MYIVSIGVSKRKREVPELQNVLTEFGKDISTRLGVHNLDDKEKDGLIIVIYNSENIGEFIERLNEVNDVSVNYMEA